MIWKLEDAKNRFSEVVRMAQSEGPQVVTKHGKESAVVMGIDQYRSLTESLGGLLDFFSNSPFGEAVRDGELRLDRPESHGRDVEL